MLAVDLDLVSGSDRPARRAAVLRLIERATIEIDRPADEVFAYATDPTPFAEWQKGVIEGKMAEPGNRIGTRCLTTRRIGFANRPVTSELAHIDPPKTWGVRGVDGPIRAIVDVTVEPLPEERAHLTIAIDFTGHGIGKLLVPLIVRREARKEMPVNVATLKQLIEKQNAEDTNARVTDVATHHCPRAQRRSGR